MKTKLKKHLSGVIFIITLITLLSPITAQIHTSDSSNQAIQKSLCENVEEMPMFPGGETALMKFISKNITYPIRAQQNRIQGKVVLRFVVSDKGQVNTVEIVRSLHPDCDTEAIRVVNLLPDFIPEN